MATASEKTIETEAMEVTEFQKGNRVVLPDYIGTIRSTPTKGTVLDDIPYTVGATDTVDPIDYIRVEIDKHPALTRREQRLNRPVTPPKVVLVNAEDLRLDVQHPKCPSCKCFTLGSVSELPLSVDDDEDDDDDDDEEDDELDELEEELDELEEAEEAVLKEPFRT